MLVTEFNDKNGIKWIPIIIKLNDKVVNKKKQSVARTYLPDEKTPYDYSIFYNKTDNFNIDKFINDWKKHPNIKKCNIVAIDTSYNTYQRLDVDDHDLFASKCPSHIMELLKQTPQYRSRSHKPGNIHYYIKFINVPSKLINKKTKQYGFCDILTGTASWCLINEEIINGDNEVVVIDYIKFITAIDPYFKQSNNITKALQQPHLETNKNKIITDFDDEIEKNINETQINKLPKTKKKIDSLLISQKQQIQFLLPILNQERCDERDKWHDVSRIIYNVLEKSGYNIFIDWSKKSNKYDKDGADALWNSFEGTQKLLKLGSLYEYAKQDNHIEYLKIKNFMEICNLYVSDKGIAEYFHKKYKDKLIFYPDNTGKWYIYDKGLWKIIKNISIIEGYISGLSDKVKLIAKELKLMKNNKSYQGIIEELDGCIEKINNILIYLSKYSNIRNTYKISCYLFKDEDFDKKLNTNIHLLCFGEYVYDLIKCEWRLTEQSDYISIKCGMTKEDFDKADTTEIMSILNDIFPNKEQLSYTIKSLSNVLYGSNMYEKVYIYSGSTGRNGKSLIMAILRSCLLDYYVELPITLITRKQGDSSSAKPELFLSRYARVVCFSEPEHNDKLNTSFVKLLTGNDQISCRPLYGEPVKFVPQFTPIILVNNITLDDCSDNAFNMRLEFNKFLCTFVPNPTKPHERKINPDLKRPKKLVELSHQLMKLLITTWNSVDIEQNKNHLIELPDCMKEYKREFIADIDIVMQWTLDNIQSVDDTTQYITLNDLYDDYLIYCKKYNESNPKNKSKLKSQLLTIYDNYKEKYQPRVENKRLYLRYVFFGIQFNKNNEDDENDLDD